MSDCSTNAFKGYDTLMLHIDFKDEETPWTYALALNGREIEHVFVGGQEHYPYTGAQNEQFFILPKPDEKLVDIGNYEYIEAIDGGMRARAHVELIQDAVERWKSSISDDIKSALFETFAKPREDKFGRKYVVVDGERYDRVCHRDHDDCEVE